MNHNNTKDIDLILQLNKLSPEMFRHRGREVDFFPYNLVLLKKKLNDYKESKYFMLTKVMKTLKLRLL